MGTDRQREVERGLRMTDEMCLVVPAIESITTLSIGTTHRVWTTATLEDLQYVHDSTCFTDVPPPPPSTFYDIIILIDGSDSFNEENGFADAQRLINSVFIPTLKNKLDNRASVTIIQFSGIKAGTSSYKPGSGGKDTNSDYMHGIVEQDCVPLDDAVREEGDFAEGLDGNSQLFLCLQDLNMESYLDEFPKKIAYNEGPRKRVMLIISDGDSDIGNLQSTTSEGFATAEEVAGKTTENYSTYPIIVRPSRSPAEEDSFFKTTLASAPRNFFRLSEKHFERDLTNAFKEIVRDF